MPFLNWVFFLDDSVLCQVVRSLTNTLLFSVYYYCWVGDSACRIQRHWFFFPLHLDIYQMCIPGLCSEQPLLADLYLLTDLCLHLLKPLQTFLCSWGWHWTCDPPPTSGAGITTPSALCAATWDTFPGPSHNFEKHYFLISFESSGKNLRKWLLSTTSPGHACCK